MTNPNANVLNSYYLKPIRDSRKSFYKKAYVREWGRYKELFSYNTKVAVVCIDPITKVNEKLVLGSHATCSATTLRHVREFMYQQGFETYEKKDLYKHYEMGNF